ncbi:hypothetical protein DOY81_005729 [Sarcophaga bullata]|nr:hypothetical protein DOY81_005729 [Sarcophaga bullata]
MRKENHESKYNRKVENRKTYKYFSPLPPSTQYLTTTSRRNK